MIRFFAGHPTAANLLMALLMISGIMALPMLHGAWLAAALLTVANAMVLARRIRNEERVLATVPAWEEAMAQRSRLIPGIF